MPQNANTNNNNLQETNEAEGSAGTTGWRSAAASQLRSSLPPARALLSVPHIGAAVAVPTCSSSIGSGVKAAGPSVNMREHSRTETEAGASAGSGPGAGSVSRLPAELLEHILSWLGGPGLVAAARVSRYWHAVSQRLARRHCSTTVPADILTEILAGTTNNIHTNSN